MKADNLQDEMFNEIRDKRIFEITQEYSFEYLKNVFERNVYPTDDAIKNLSAFDEPLPTSSTKAEEVIHLLNTYGHPATVTSLGGRYFGFVCGSALPIGIAAKNLSTYWDQCPTMNVLSPVSGKLESVVENWFVELLSLPKDTSAGFVSGTTVANVCGLAAARYQILKRQNWDVNLKGLYGAPRIKIVTGRQAHSSVLRAVTILGFGQESIEWVDTDDQGRIVLESMPKLDENTILILQAGNVNSGSFDNFEILCEMAHSTNTWVHIDGAFGLWAKAVNKLKHLTKGIEKADSWAIDGHKTLNTPYDCGIVLCKDKEALTNSLRTSGSYLVESDERDGMYYAPEMSRRARVIELWATMKYLGKEGIDQMVLTMHERAKQFASEIGIVDGFYVENDVVFNQVIVRCDSDELTEKILRNVQELRDCWVGGSLWFGKRVIRISVCSWATTVEDISLSVKSFKKALKMGRN